jgi:hypothetical protein
MFPPSNPPIKHALKHPKHRQTMTRTFFSQHVFANGVRKIATT